MKRWGIVGAQLALLGMASVADAAGLGVQGDSFFRTFVNWLPGVSYAAMVCGILLWLSSSNDYNQGVLAGGTALMVRGLIGGGAVGILSGFGFSQGALLP